MNGKGLPPLAIRPSRPLGASATWPFHALRGVARRPKPLRRSLALRYHPCSAVLPPALRVGWQGWRLARFKSLDCRNGEFHPLLDRFDGSGRRDRIF
jgi:hypothetical protein